MVPRMGEGQMPCTFFLSEPQLKTTVKGESLLIDHYMSKLILFPVILNININSKPVLFISGDKSLPPLMHKH